MFRALTRLLAWPIGRGREPSQDSAGDAGDGHALVQHLAHELYRLTLSRGGWATDMGILGAEAFEDEAARTLSAIALGRAEKGPPMP